MNELLQFLHVAAAIVWVGAGTYAFVLLRRLNAADDRAGITALAAQDHWATMGLVTPAALVVLLAGIGMGLVRDSFDWGAPWISIGFLGVIVSLGLRHGVIRPGLERLATATDSGGSATGGDAGAVRRVTMFGAIDLAVLYIAVYAMSTRLGA
jgi:uncharacterized membrane protein